MKIGFYTVFKHDPRCYAHAQLMIQSARAVMPGIEIVQFSDETSPMVIGADRIVRKPKGHILERRMEHYSECDGDWLFVDTDVVFKADVSDVFNDVFDVAVTNRQWPHLMQICEAIQTMPYNSGVVFSRSKEFWKSVLIIWNKEENKDWMSEQRAIHQVVEMHNFAVKILPGFKYNCPPSDSDDPCFGAAIVHYKGPRKEWLPAQTTNQSAAKMLPEVDYVKGIPRWLKNEQVRDACARKVGKIEPGELQSEPIAIVGFGPSLHETWKELSKFKHVMTMSGSHKFLVERGIIPEFHCEVDTLSHKAGLIGKPNAETVYLISSTCHKAVFDLLEGCDVRLWHPMLDEEEYVSIVPENSWMILGGTTVGTRAIKLARFLGFTDLHIFGLDGSFEKGKPVHAASHPREFGKAFEYLVDGEAFWTNEQLLESAMYVQRILAAMPDTQATFYGHGLIQTMARNPMEKSKGQTLLGCRKPITISEHHRERTSRLHRQQITFGGGDCAYAENLLALYEQLKAKSILDFGCGRGRLSKRIAIPIWEYDPCIPGKTEAPRSADIVVCSRVLECVEPDNLDAVIRELARCSKMVCYILIESGESRFVFDDGKNASVIQKNIEEWWAAIEEYFDLKPTDCHERGGVMHFLAWNKKRTVPISLREQCREITRSVILAKPVEPEVKRTKPMRILIGWDSSEPEAYDVAKFSIDSRARKLVDVQALKLDDVKSILTRPTERRDGKLWCPISQAPMSTEFAISRFCVPFLQQDGWVLFMDSDVICLTDIGELFALADERYAVMCVKHNCGEASYPAGTKMDGQLQTFYRRKNWSSVMLFNCSHPAHKRLTLENLNTWPGRDLHAFRWLEDSEIGELPAEWNVLVGVNGYLTKEAKLLHFTLGGQFTPGWKGGPCDDLWLEEQAAMTMSRQQNNFLTGADEVPKVGEAGGIAKNQP